MPGPILFFVYVNDLPDLLQGHVILFADDVKLVSAKGDNDNLQHDLQHAWDGALF